MAQILQCRFPQAHRSVSANVKASRLGNDPSQNVHESQPFTKREQGLPVDARARKAIPLCTGVLDFFPDALALVARVSLAGRDQHHPGEPLKFHRGTSPDDADALLRHLAQRGTLDEDSMPHSAKVAWRALAMLQRECDAQNDRSV